MKTLVVCMVVGLGFVVMHLDNQLDVLRDKVAYLDRPRVEAPKAVAPPAQRRAETHDEMLERVRTEAMRRREDYCKTHPNLMVRIGCP